MHFYLIRHTTPAISAGICYGQSNVDVAETFCEELQVVREKINAIPAGACYSSPLLRCSKLASALGLAEPQQDPRLMELDFGDWEMQAWDNIPREHLDQWGQEYTHVAPPGGETFNQLHGRVTAFAREAATRHCGQDVVVVTHAGVIRALLAEVLNLPLNEVFRFHLDFGSVTKLRFNETSPSIVYVNR